MPRFIYDVIDSKGREINGQEIEASSVSALSRDLKRLGHTIKRIQPKSDIQVQVTKAQGFFFGSVSAQSIVIFTRQLATLLAGGIPIVRSLKALSNQGSDPTLMIRIFSPKIVFSRSFIP